jgi:DNA-binding NarL/FixJ family response regulator
MLRARDPNDKSLTPREMEVLHYVSPGLTNHEIANKMFITSYPVKRHISSIIEKLEARNRTGAVYKAVKQKIVS